jgi:hypothetical protein
MIWYVLLAADGFNSNHTKLTDSQRASPNNKVNALAGAKTARVSSYTTPLVVHELHSSTMTPPTLTRNNPDFSAHRT